MQSYVNNNECRCSKAYVKAHPAKKLDSKVHALLINKDLPLLSVGLVWVPDM